LKLSEGQTELIVHELLSCKDDWNQMIAKSFLTKKSKERYQQILEGRLKNLDNQKL
jgi:hypothetical protein